MATCVLRLLCSTLQNGWLGSGATPVGLAKVAVFLFLYFIFSIWKFTVIYPAAPLPGGRDLVAPLRGGKGFCAKIFAKIFVRKSLGAGRPAAGQPALPPLYKGWLVPHPSFASLQFQKQRKKREGGREAKPCRIFEPATAGNQNSSTLYK